MANYIPFEKLEVGKTYYMQSRYWGQVLGKATITELHLPSGDGWVDNDWGETGKCRFEADKDWMWDEMPTDEEQKKRMDDGWREHYTPPRILKGVMYKGKGIPMDWKEKLDELITNLYNTFENDKRFKVDKRGNGSFIWASKLNYDISPLLVRGNGQCDWDSINYIKMVSKFDISAAEQDGFGWLVGKIVNPITNQKILYD